MEHPFTWYSWIQSVIPLGIIPEHTFHTWVVMGVLLVLAVLVRGKLLRAKDPAVPDEGLSLSNVFEFLIELVVNLSDGIIGKKGRRYASLFTSFFIFILTANLLGLVPGFS